MIHGFEREVHSEQILWLLSTAKTNLKCIKVFYAVLRATSFVLILWKVQARSRRTYIKNVRPNELKLKVKALER